MVNKSIKSYNFSHDSWQILPYCLGSGANQMAKDAMLLANHGNSRLSSLRFYGWQPVAISLGYHQRHIPSHWHQLADIVSRPSGGRAVLHSGDLTYAVITEAGDRSKSEMYRYICQFLIDGFAELGIKLSYGTSKTGYIHNPSCFATATNADLVTEQGLKLIGSAQVYRLGINHKSVLHHGSIQIKCDRPLLKAVFGVVPPIISLQELINDVDIIPTVVEILTQSAVKTFGIQEFVEIANIGTNFA